MRRPKMLLTDKKKEEAGRDQGLPAQSGRIRVASRLPVSGLFARGTMLRCARVCRIIDSFAPRHRR